MKNKILGVLKGKVTVEYYNYFAHGEPHVGTKISQQSLEDSATEIMNLIPLNSSVGGSLPINELDQLLYEVGTILEGWHQDGTAWTEYDEGVRNKVTEFRTKYTYRHDR